MMTSSPNAEKEAFSIEEFARRISVSRRLIYALIERGEGPQTIRVGRRRLIRQEDGKAWLQSRGST